MVLYTKSIFEQNLQKINILYNKNDKLKMLPILGEYYCHEILFTISLSDKGHLQSSYQCYEEQDYVGILKHVWYKHPSREI